MTDIDSSARGTSVRLAIVLPAFEDNESCMRVCAELGRQFGDHLRLVIVDDGSVSSPVDAAPLREANIEGEVLRLRRNVGHQRAIAIGLCHVAATMPQVQRVVVMDSDGEDVPSSVPELLAALDAEDVEVVVARRRSRIEKWWFKMFYSAYRLLFKTMTGRAINFGNFMALKPQGLRRVVSMYELWIHLASSVLTSRLRVAFCPIDRGPRYAGRSRLNFVGLVLHGFRGLMVFAEDVLVRVGIVCMIVATLSVVASIAAVALKVMGYATPGWFSVALGILVLVFLQTGALTLMTLMLTGIVRGSAMTTPDYRSFIDSVVKLGPATRQEAQ